MMPIEADWPSCVRTGREVTYQRDTISPTHSYHSASPKASERIQLPDIGSKQLQEKRFSLKVRSCSVKKDE